MLKELKMLCLMILSVHAVFAQEETGADSIGELKAVIITYHARHKTPVTFQNLNSSLIRVKSTGQEPSLLLAETPAVTAYSDAGSSQGYAYFRLRGIDQTRINITLDGVPMNEPEDQGAYFSNYPDILNSVSNIQIQRGAGTTKNGAASYGGSVQLFSPDLRDSANTTVGINYGSFNSFRMYGEYNTGIKKGKALYIRASQINSAGYKYNSSNDSRSVFVSGGLFITKSAWKLNLLAGQQKNQLAWLGVSDSLINIDRKTNVNENERDRFFQSHIQLQHTLHLSRYARLQSAAYYTYLKGNYDFNLNSFLGLPSTSELYNYAFQSHLFGFYSNYTFTKKLTSFTAGVHGNLYNRQHVGSEKAIGELYTNTGYKNEASIFAKVDRTIGRFVLFSDVQYRFTFFDYNGSVPFQQLKWSFLNPKVGVSFAPGSNLVLYYSLGKTSREPTRNDLFGGSDDLLADSAGNAIISNKTPESVVNHELGFRLQKSGLKLNLNFYLMDFENEIVLDGKFGPNGLALTNKVDRSLRAGIEWSLNYQLSRKISLVNQSSFNYSRITEQAQTFSPILTPAVIINQEVVFQQKQFSAALSGRYQHKSFIDFANSAIIGNYVLLNASIQYHYKIFQLGLFANNITNVKYFNNGYVDVDGQKKFFVQAPANFSIALKCSF